MSPTLLKKLKLPKVSKVIDFKFFLMVEDIVSVAKKIDFYFLKKLAFFILSSFAWFKKKLK